MTNTTYNCVICDKSSPQKSHHQTHLKSETHLNKRMIFSLQLEKKSLNELKKEYPSIEIENKDDFIKALVESKEMEPIVTPKKTDNEKYERTNTIVYELSDEEKTQMKHDEEFKNEFKKFLDKCHNILRSGASIVGTDALDDIVYTFMMVYLSDKVTSDTGIYNFGNLDKAYYRNRREKNKVKEYLPYLNVEYLLNHVDELRIEEHLDAIKKIGYILTKHPSTKNIIKQDNFINCKNSNIYAKLLSEINEFSKKQDIFKCNDLIGLAYEHFVNDYNDGGGKSEGQFFTERPLMNMCLKMIDEEDINEFGINGDSTIGDEFCGTFGFPINLKTHLKKRFDIDIKDKNIYGVEQNDRLSKYANLNAMFSLSDCRNVKQGDSFITNVSPHLDIGVYNVPFGKDSIYDQKKELYSTSEGLPDFETIFKSKGPLAVMASQMAFHKVTKIGLCIIKDGVETSGNTLKGYRKFLCDNYVIKKIKKIPSGTFSSTGTATVCIYFVKKEGHSTENIQFLQMSDDCSKITEICNITKNDLKKNNYSWDPNTYLIDEKMKELMEKSKCDFKKIGDIFDNVDQGVALTKQNMVNGQYNVIGGGKIIGTHNQFNREGSEIILTRVGDIHVNYYNVKYYLTENAFSLKNNDTTINNYLYYLLMLEKEKYLRNSYIGSGQQVISKGRLNNVVVPLPKLEIRTKYVEQLNDLSKQKEVINDMKKGIKRQMKYFIDSQIQKGLKEYVKLDTIYNTINGKYNSNEMDNNGEIPFFACKAKNPVGIHSTHSHDEPEYILLVTSGGSQGNPYGEGVGMGKCYYVNGKSACRAGVLALIPKENNIYSEFHCHYLQNYRKMICDKATFTTNLGTIRKGEIENLNIPIVSNHHEITRDMNELSDKIKNLDNDIVFIDNLMKEIMQSTYQ